MRMRIYGLDFTSAPGRGKPLTVAVCALDGSALRLERLEQLPGLEGFEALLGSPGPWMLGADFPFGQPRRLVEALHWPDSWEGYVARVAEMGKQRYEEALRAYIQPRAKGDKLHRRAADVRAGAISPMKLDYVPVGKMFFEGAVRLSRSSVCVAPCRPTLDDRIVVEAYPALVARWALGKRRSYKEPKNAGARALRREARAEILRRITGPDLRQAYGLALRLKPGDGNEALEDDRGDLLDSILCAVQAAWAWTRRGAGYGLPPDCDPLEGHIADPATG
jgi:hypothetical protein